MRRLAILTLSLNLACGVVAHAQSIRAVAARPPTARAADSAATLPPAPSSLQALAASDSQVAMTWQDNSAGAAEVHVESRTANGTYTEIGAVPPDSAGLIALDLSPSTTYFFRVWASDSAGHSGYSNEVSVTTLASAACLDSDTTMCLDGGRFRVGATYLADPDPAGQAQTMKVGDDSGYLWFFDAANIEVVVKVLNGCAVNSSYWVFAAGLTNLHTAIVVTDTTTGTTEMYVTRQGVPFLPLQDIAAFPSCP